MTNKRNKRSLPSLSPTHTTTNNTMEESLAKLHEKLDSFGGQLAKIDTLEQTIGKLVHENTAFREELRKKDIIIDQLTEKVNRLDQSLRANSLRIHGLPITNNTPATEIPNIVFKEIITPILEAAKASGDIPPTHDPPLHFTLSSAFSIPSKKNSSSSPVIVKFYSESIRSLVFKHKRNALPTVTDLPSNRVRPKFSIYEDLTAANHTHLRSFADDPRIKSAWTYGGQIRFKPHHEDTIYKVSSLSDTYDKLVKPHPGPSAAAAAHSPSNPTSNRFSPLMDYT
jgi:hypothetical protein